jgi:hypothetical protein
MTLISSRSGDWRWRRTIRLRGSDRGGGAILVALLLACPFGLGAAHTATRTRLGLAQVRRGRNEIWVGRPRSLMFTHCERYYRSPECPPTCASYGLRWKDMICSQPENQLNQPTACTSSCSTFPEVSSRKSSFIGSR